MTFRNGRPKASFNILVIHKNSNLAVTFINRTKPEKNSNFPQYFCHRKGSTTTIYGNFSLVTWHQKNTLPYQLSIIALGLSSYPCFPFLAFCMAGVFLASAAAYYGIIDQKCWLLFVCHCREARGCEQKNGRILQNVKLIISSTSLHQDHRELLHQQAIVYSVKSKIRQCNIRFT